MRCLRWALAVSGCAWVLVPAPAWALPVEIGAATVSWVSPTPPPQPAPAATPAAAEATTAVQPPLTAPAADVPAAATPAPYPPASPGGAYPPPPSPYPYAAPYPAPAPYPYPYPYPYGYPSPAYPAYPPPYSAPYPPPPPPAPPPGAEIHDGFYLRMHFGINWTGLSAKSGDNTFDFTGHGASLAVAPGLSVTPRLVLYFELLIAGATSAQFKTNGVDNGANRLDTNLYGAGPGAAYYFGPNLFAAATLLLARVSVTTSDQLLLERSQGGLAVEALFGKEWWVSANWGLGVSGQLILGSMKGEDSNLLFDSSLQTAARPTWHATSASLLFSATYN